MRATLKQLNIRFANFVTCYGTIIDATFYDDELYAILLEKHYTDRVVYMIGLAQGLNADCGFKHIVGANFDSAEPAKAHLHTVYPSRRSARFVFWAKGSQSHSDFFREQLEPKILAFKAKQTIKNPDHRPFFNHYPDLDHKCTMQHEHGKPACKYIVEVNHVPEEDYLKLYSAFTLNP